MILFWIYFPNLVGLDGFEEASRQEKFSNEVDNLHCTEDGEAGEESHGAANQTQLSVDCHLHIPLIVVIGPRVKVDLNYLKGHIKCFILKKKKTLRTLSDKRYSLN